MTLDKVKKQYKNTNLLLDILLEDYHNVTIYIRLDYYKKEKVHKLSWIDLNTNVISYEYIPDGVIEHINKLLSGIKDYQDKTNGDYKVTINSYSKEYKFKVIFTRYIPKEIPNIFNLMVLVFDNLPRKLNGFLQEMGTLLIGKPATFEETFKFDLFKDDIDSKFRKDVVNKGNDYFNLGRVLFLEKVGDRYYAVVGGKSLYVVIIKYEEDKKETIVYCSCPCDFRCKHIYAVIKAIRENKIRRFYKITHKNDDMELLDRVMNFNFLLTIGIDDQNNNYLVVEDGLLKLLPVVNNEGKSEWLILEDDDKNTLSDRLTKILKE